MTSKPSRARAQRLAAEARRERAAQPPSLSAELEAMLFAYAPDGIAASNWDAIKPVHAEILRRSKLRGKESFRHRCTELANYLGWRASQGLSLAIENAMTFEAIDEHYARGCVHLAEKSRNDRRSRLRKLAERANPKLSVLPRAVSLGYQAINPGYTRAEELTIMRVAARQRRPAARRSLSIVVGCCAGAGLDAADLRYLRRNNFDDLGSEGIVINVPGKRARRVVVRKEYEELGSRASPMSGRNETASPVPPTRLPVADHVL